jgi:hypothetical protein
MRRQLGHGLCIATLLVVTACGGDDDSASDSSTAATDLVDGSGVTTDSTGTGGSTDSTDTTDASDSTDSTVAGASTTVSGSTGTTVAGSTGTTVAGSTATTVAGSSATTVAGSGTTAAPVTTSAIPTTLVELALVSDGLGPLRFGSDGDTVILIISSVLGPPISDAPAEYPTPAGDGSYTSLDEELGWAQPFGRTVCWANGFCGEFGGATAGPYTFQGWFYAETDVDPLSAPSGLDVGSTWAEFADVITVNPGGCYSVGYGTADGVTLAMQSSGEPFVNVDEDGNETPSSPDPADVTIMQMQAGEQVTYLFEDC